jgi:hypothetical protein
MKLKKLNYYGFDHESVNKQFKGDLTFVNDFCVNDEYHPVAVYHAANPDRSKGHKDYLLIQTSSKGGLIRGMNADEIDKFRYQMGIHCPKCDEVIYSIMRHDYHKCSCGNASVDGGRDYLHTSGEGTSLIRIDLLTDELTKETLNDPTNREAVCLNKHEEFPT